MLISSSNKYKFYRHYDYSKYPIYVMVKCTRNNTLKVQMKSLEEKTSWLWFHLSKFHHGRCKKKENEDPNNFAENFDDIIAAEI